MKVIKTGNASTEWTKRLVCPECQALLEVVESDLYVVNTAVNYAGETWEPELRCNCGSCHSQIDMSNKVPSGIQYKLYDSARKKLR